MRKHMPTRILAGGDAHLVWGRRTTRTRSDFASPSMARHPAPTTALMSMRTDGGGFPTSGFTNWCGRQGRSASTRLKSSSSAQASAAMVLRSDRSRPARDADAAGALASGRVRGVNAARDGWDHGSQRCQDEINRCFMAAPGANGLALCNCVYGSRLGSSVLQISCGSWRGSSAPAQASSPPHYRIADWRVAAVPTKRWQTFAASAARGQDGSVAHETNGHRWAVMPIGQQRRGSQENALKRPIHK